MKKRILIQSNTMNISKKVNLKYLISIDSEIWCENPINAAKPVPTSDPYLIVYIHYHKHIENSSLKGHKDTKGHLQRPLRMSI